MSHANGQIGESSWGNYIREVIPKNYELVVETRWRQATPLYPLVQPSIVRVPSVVQREWSNGSWDNFVSREQARGAVARAEAYPLILA